MRVLIVEDEESLANLLKKSLKEERFSVDIAPDGEKGSYLARSNDYDLIILDNMLPKKSGLEVCKQIRENGHTVPIIVLSAVDGTDTKVEFLQSGADDYITKPFSFSELFARIQAALRRQAPIENEILTVEDLTLDTNKGIVSRSGKAIELTNKEYTLLEYLMRNEGTVLTHAMLLEHVWDMNTDPFTKTVESHIASLRKKIGKNHNNKLIHTIRGRGYKLEAERQFRNAKK